MTEAQLRIGDGDRDTTAQALAEHYAAGRLTREELDHRTGVVLRARTGLDLAEVLADLPPLETTASGGATVAPRQRTPASASRRSTVSVTSARTVWRAAVLAPWAMFGVFFVLIWRVTGAGHFWPIWPILGWGIAVGISGVTAHTLPEVFLERRAAQRAGHCRHAGRTDLR